MSLIGKLPIILMPNHFRIKRRDDFPNWVTTLLEEHLSEYPDLCFSIGCDSIVGSVLTSYLYLAFEIKLYWADEDIILEARRISGESDEFDELYRSIIAVFSDGRVSDRAYTEEITVAQTKEMILYEDPEVSLKGIQNVGIMIENEAMIPFLFNSDLLTVLMNVVLRPEVTSYDLRKKEHALYSLAFIARQYTQEWESYLKKDENDFLAKLVDLVSEGSQISELMK